MRLIARLIDDTVASWLSNKTHFIMSHNYNGTSYYKYNKFQICGPTASDFNCKKSLWYIQINPWEVSLSNLCHSTLGKIALEL